MRSGIVHHKSDRKPCVIPTADRNNIVDKNVKRGPQIEQKFIFKQQWQTMLRMYCIDLKAIVVMFNGGRSYRFTIHPINNNHEMYLHHCFLSPQGYLCSTPLNRGPSECMNTVMPKLCV